jgi:LPS O-antigen subunit length determinant protein (WzzB/FepE family)
MEKRSDQLLTPAAPEYGEMSLSDIVDGLQRGRKLIVSGAILGGIITALFLNSQRNYIAEAQFLPPSAAEVEPLNIRSASIPVTGPGVPLRATGGRGELLSNFAPEEVYGQFLLTVQSHSLHRRVLEEQGILAGVIAETVAEGREALDESFREWESDFSLQSDSPDPDVLGFVRISQRGKDAAAIALFLNRVAELAEQQVLDNLKRVVFTRVLDRRSEIETILVNERARAASVRADEILRMEESQAIDVSHLRSLIEVRQRQMEVRNIDQVARLKEALAIAEAAGMEDPLPGLSGTTSLIALDGIAGNARSTPSSGAVVSRTKVDINATPLFFRGTKMLKAELEAIQKRTSSDPFVEDLRLLEEQLQQVLANPELEALRNRGSDDPFIQGLRELEVEGQTLAAIKLPDEGLAAMIFDQKALPPGSPLIGWSYLLPGILLGLAIGVILALLQRVLYLQRRNRSAA